MRVNKLKFILLYFIPLYSHCIAVLNPLFIKLLNYLLLIYLLSNLLSITYLLNITPYLKTKINKVHCAHPNQFLNKQRDPNPPKKK